MKFVKTDRTLMFLTNVASIIYLTSYYKFLFFSLVMQPVLAGVPVSSFLQPVYFAGCFFLYIGKCIFCASEYFFTMMSLC